MRGSNWVHYLCLLFFHCFQYTICVSAFPSDSFLIDCGGTKSSMLDDGRVFQPDSGYPNLSFSDNSHIVNIKPQMGVFSNISTPYDSARVFKKTSSYTIRTKKIGRHWLRLYFHPIQTPHFDLIGSVFSVMANGITLFHRLSFSNYGHAPCLLKEYVVEVFDKSPQRNLVLTFSPSNGSIAFINGIEIVLVPNMLFSASVMPIPNGPTIQISGTLAFETAYRINMGGPVLTPKNDSLWRNWESDQPYLLNSASAHSVSIDPSLIKYPKGLSTETAPRWIYSTAQEMAEANVSNQNFNISWAYKAEPGFNYLIKMHFCDIISKAPNSLIFRVYINNQSALDSFDFSGRRIELLEAYVLHFMVYLPIGSDRILVQVGPPRVRNFPVNAILNGLEIMKMSNPCDSLQGHIQSDCSVSNGHKKKKNQILLGIICSSIFVLLLFTSILLFIFFCRKKEKLKRRTSTWLPLFTRVENSNSKISVGSFPSTPNSLSLGRVLTFSEISEATRNFDESLVLGVGGFGKVYKGILNNEIPVAVKRGNPRSQQGLVEFRTEIEMLSKLRHRHLVSLIGYCEELNEIILVYEFMEKGPLRRHLYGSNLHPLTWKQRLEILIGAAKGLHYLHTGAAESVVIHRDVKTTNVLLDENLTAKVADFGLSKLGPTLDQTHVSTAVKGSFGYLDPEYFRRQQLTDKSDVYSFGVVMIEVLCARPAINPALAREEVNIAEWAMKWQKWGQLEKVMDPHLKGCVDLESLRKYGETAEKCLAENGVERPSMGDVLWNLEYALQLQEASVQTFSGHNSTDRMSYIYMTEIESCANDGDDGSDAMSSGVFSELMNPNGR